MRNFDKVTTIPDRAIASYQFHEETERSERLEKDKLTTQQTCMRSPRGPNSWKGRGSPPSKPLRFR